MRCLILVLSIFCSLHVLGQNRDGNNKPIIIGQNPLGMDEDTNLTVELGDLYVIDWDDTYPYGFTLNLYPGNHYTISGNNTIVPEPNYNGTLKVPVTVNDGTDNSKKYDLSVDVFSVNDPPVITGQNSLSTNQNQSLTISLNNLIVSDPDNSYPNDFSLSVYAGSNYNVSGNTITPVTDFVGTLSVPVSVNDGSVNSAVFNLQVQVIRTNVAPVITGQATLATTENQSITIKLADLIVSDPDDTYPNGFTLKIFPGANYSVSGNTVIPANNFTGTLSVNVTVSDGKAESAPYSLSISVKPVSSVPQIIGQVALKINEDESLTILLSHLKVVDSNSQYPTGFSVNVLSGDSYTVGEGDVVKPAANFYGTLTVPVTVSDEANNTSEPYNLLIVVNPINDAPTITSIEDRALNYAFNKGPQLITTIFDAQDVDDDSLSVGEIKFEKESYRAEKDELIFSNTPNIRGVFDSNAGILSLIGKAPVSEYVSAVRSVQYNYAGSEDDSLLTSKKLIFTLNDGKNVSAPQTRVINLGGSFVNLDIPTGFTPNGDQVNDTWMVTPSKGMDDRANPTIRVYSRSGILVYEATGFYKEWDGRFNGDFLPPDTYYYTIDLNLPTTKSKYNGLVTILR